MTERRHVSEFDYDRHEIERALLFLAEALSSTGHNPKPVFLHSIQVAEMLWDRGADQDTVVAAVLHDVVEDTAVTSEQVEQAFGPNVAEYVDAMTLTDSRDFEQSSARCAELGPGVLAIRAADLIQNSYYYHLASAETKPRLKAKFTWFMDTYGQVLDTAMASELAEAYSHNVEHLLDET